MNKEAAIEFVTKAIRREGADAFDIMASSARSLSVELYKSKIKNLETSAEKGIGVRIFRNEAPGYAYTENFSEDSLNKMIRDAMEHAELSDPVQIVLPGPVTLPDIDLKRYDATAETIDADYLKRLSLEMESHALGYGDIVVNIPHLGAGLALSSSILAASTGSWYSVQHSSLSAGIGILLEQGESKKMGYFGDSHPRPENVSSEYIAEKAVQKGKKLLGAFPVASGEFPFILSKEVAPSVISFFRSIFYAENVQKNMSRLAGKIGESIAPSFFSLHDIAHHPDMAASRLVDGEGVPTSDLEVIQNGKLMTYLYTLESAGRAGERPTGHGFRSYSGKVSTGFHNMVVPRGEQTLSDLLKSMHRGILVEKLEGASGVSPVSGDISIGIQGHFVENGEISHPIDRMTMNINFFDLLSRIQAVSDEYEPGRRSVFVPDIFVSSAAFAG